MQFRAPYIGYLFSLSKAHVCSETLTLQAGMVGTLKAVNERDELLLLEFPLAPPPIERMAKAWVPETSVLLFGPQLAPKSEGAPAPSQLQGRVGHEEQGVRPAVPPAAMAPAAPKKPWRVRFPNGLVKVASDNIDLVGLFAPDDTPLDLNSGVRVGLLVVVFKRGQAYSYSGVELDTFEGLLAAKSATKYFNAHIKGNDWMHPTKLED